MKTIEERAEELYKLPYPGLVRNKWSAWDDSEESLRNNAVYDERQAYMEGTIDEKQNNIDFAEWIQDSIEGNHLARIQPASKYAGNWTTVENYTTGYTTSELYDYWYNEIKK